MNLDDAIPEGPIYFESPSDLLFADLFLQVASIT